jgi:hypothetical protein
LPKFSNLTACRQELAKRKSGLAPKLSFGWWSSGFPNGRTRRLGPVETLAFPAHIAAAKE